MFCQEFQRTSIFFFWLFHSCWNCLSLVYIFVATFSFCSPDLAISILHLNLTYIQKAGKGNLLLNNILQNTKETIHKNNSMENALECSSDSNVL